MKKKTMVLLLFVAVFAIVCGFIVSNATKATYTFNWLVENSDYMILASNSLPIKKTENPEYTVCYDLPLSEYYEKDGKYYLKLDVICYHSHIFSEGVTIISDKRHIKLDKDRIYILFIKKIEGREGFYTITNEKTGIIELTSDKIKPYDRDLKKDIDENFESTDVFLEWFYRHCEKDVKRIKKEKKETLNDEPYVAPETTTAPF